MSCGRFCMGSFLGGGCPASQERGIQPPYSSRSMLLAPRRISCRGVADRSERMPIGVPHVRLADSGPRLGSKGGGKGEEVLSPVPCHRKKEPAGNGGL